MAQLLSFTFVGLILSLAWTAGAAPILEERDGVTVASAAQIASYTSFLNFARAAYCNKASAKWNCGGKSHLAYPRPACSANPDFINYAGGGDGSATPHWYAGWSPSLKSIIIAHEGTDPTKFLSLLNDADFFLTPLDQVSLERDGAAEDSTRTSFRQSLFPKISPMILGTLNSSIAGGEAHNGFQSAFERSATSVLAAVKKIMAAHSTSKVTVVGHSLGGAIALLDSIYLKMQIPSLTIKTITAGVPRVGNPDFVNHLASFDITRITHAKDPIPIVPGRGMGFRHPQGEVHQGLDGTWNNCAGQDNTDPRCSTGA
ncbi:hypothetical protein FRB99_002552, partial [Tulasnella sp. 403]